MTRVLFVSFHFSEYSVRSTEAVPNTSIRLVLNEANCRNELTTDLFCSVPRVDLAFAGWSKPAAVIGALHRFLHECNSFRPSVLHFQEYPTLFQLALWVAGRAYPRVLTIHDVNPHSGADSNWPRYRYWIRNYMRRSANALIVHGIGLKEELEQLVPSAREVHVVPHVALGRSSNAENGRGLPLRVLFFGRIERYKGLEILIRAMQSLDADRTTVELRVAGNGTELERLRPLLEALPRTSIVGRRLTPDEVGKEFDECDLVVLPYLDASQSGVVSLAFGSGKPVVASNVGAIAEVVQDGANGLLIEPGEPTALAAALETLDQDRALLRRLSEGARSTASGTLSSAAVGTRLLAVYESVAAGSRDSSVPQVNRPSSARIQ